MIHLLIGTKAQFIKVAPLIRHLRARAIPCRLIDTGQHTDLTAGLREIFGLAAPDASLETRYPNINSLPRATVWLAGIGRQLAFRRKALIRRLFEGQPGICLVHGDTVSTLIGIALARAAGLEVAHLEAGLRSFSLIDPFPEELIRLIAMRSAEYLFAPSAWAADNLKRMRVRGRIFDIGANTVTDAIDLMRPASDRVTLPVTPPYALMSIHRFENLYRKDRMRLIVELAHELKGRFTVIFILHQPTMRRLAALGLTERLRAPHIQTLSIRGYDHFLALIRHAAFVVTDGGSIQEECYALDIPCLLARARTERRDGLGENVCLSGFDRRTIARFIGSYHTYHRTQPRAQTSASEKIARILQDLDTKG